MQHRVHAHVNWMTERMRQFLALRFIPEVHLRRHRRRDVGDYLAGTVSGAANVAERFDGDRLGRQDAPHPRARWTRAAQLRAQILTDALARKLEQSEIRKRLDRCARAIAAQPLFEGFDYLRTRRLRSHVDEVHDDDAADVA